MGNVGFDSTGRALIGEDAKERIREYIASDAAPATPLKRILDSYMEAGASGEFVDRLVAAVYADALADMDARLKRLERS